MQFLRNSDKVLLIATDGGGGFQERWGSDTISDWLASAFVQKLQQQHQKETGLDSLETWIPTHFFEALN